MPAEHPVLAGLMSVDRAAEALVAMLAER